MSDKLKLSHSKADIRNPLRYFLMNADCFAIYQMGLFYPHLIRASPYPPHLMLYAFEDGGLLVLRSTYWNYLTDDHSFFSIAY